MTFEVRRGYADTDLGQLHYAEAGSGAVVLLLHQTPRSSDEYRELLPLLARTHRAIAMDMYGFGLSAKPVGPQTIEQYASGALALVDALGIDEFSVMGHHTGSIVAVEVAAGAAGRVSSAILSSPSYTDETFRLREASGPGVDDASPASDGTHLTTLWDQRSPFYPGDADLLNRYIRDCLAPGVDPIEGHRACARYVMEERIPRVTAPALVLGAQEDPFTFPDVERVAAALVSSRSVKVEVISGGMIPLMEQKSTEVATLVREFLCGT